MSDSADLEGMGELVETLRKVECGACLSCPLYYENHFALDDECDSIVMDMFNVMYSSVELHCQKVLDKKIDEIIRYLLERSLKDE